MFGESKWHNVVLVSGQHVFAALVAALQHSAACCGKKAYLLLLVLSVAKPVHSRKLMSA